MTEDSENEFLIEIDRHFWELVAGKVAGMSIFAGQHNLVSKVETLDKIARVSVSSSKANHVSIDIKYKRGLMT